MSDESISLEETNKLRISLGLKPIPAPTDPTPTPESLASDESQSSRQGEDLSVEETNRIRVSLGLKPLPTGPGGLVATGNTDHKKTDDQIAEENWAQSQKEIQRKENETKLMKKIQLAKERAEKNRLLEQKSLGESVADETMEDTGSWLKNLGRKQKLSAARKRERQFDEDEVSDKGLKEEGDSIGYDTADLAGLKVGHSLEDLTGFNNDVILTLKDGHVLDEDEEDELVSESLVERNKSIEAAKLKKGQLLSTGYDDEAEEGMLSKYDEVIMGKKDTSFVLTGAQNLPKFEKTLMEASSKSRGTIISLNLADGEEDELSSTTGRSNYEEAKPKKLKKKNLAKIKDDMSKRRRINPEERVAPTVLVGQDEDSVIVDDDDLQAALAINRRKVQRTRKIKTVDEMVDTITSLEATPQYDETLQSGMIINDTTEFLTNLQTISVDEASNEEGIMSIDQQPEIIDVRDQSEIAEVKDEPEEYEVPSVFEDEPSISSNMGLADVFNMAKQQGFIKVDTPEERERKQLQREQRDVYKRLEKQCIMAEIEQRRLKENELSDIRLASLSAQEKEDYIASKNRKLDMEQARIAQKMLENYKPDVKLEYKDEFGNNLNQREAYKQLSHAFHGKGPGKGRIEKKLKRMEEERNMEKGQSMSQSVMDAASSERKASVRLQ